MEEGILREFRRRCLAYPEAMEVEQFGHPWFKAGKRPFAIFGKDEGRLTFSFSTSRMDQEGLCQLEGFWPTPYMHQHGWTTMAADDPDWGLVDELLDSAYRHVALKRMLKALDDAQARAAG